MSLRISNIVHSEYSLLPGFLIGITCTINGFFINLGSLNLRINDIAFYILIVYWLLNSKPKRFFYDSKIKVGMIIVIFMFIYMVAIRMLFYDTYPPIYQDFFVKYLINKLIWFPIYIGFFMLYGGKDFIIGILIGIAANSLINSFLVIYEYISISNGIIEDYSFLKLLGISVEEKKLKIFNQGLIRPTGFMIDPNYTGAYAGIGAIVWDYIWNLSRKKIFIVAAIISIIPMFLLFSRTGLFSFILCFIISILFHVSNRKKFKLLSPYILITFIIATIFIFSVLLVGDDNMIENLTRRMTMKDGSSMARFEYVEYYFNKINIFQFLFGVGMAGSFLSNFFGTDQVLHPESSYIAIIMEYGFVFMSFYVLVLYITLKRLLKQNYYFALIFIYINLIGISYNFLGDRLYYFLVICFILYTQVESPLKIRNLYDNDR